VEENLKLFLGVRMVITERLRKLTAKSTENAKKVDLDLSNDA
jgi:hypothetical protein